MVFIDEIHRLARPAEEMLYLAMEDFRVDVVVGKGPGATAIPLEIAPFTLVGATTRAGLLPAPLRDRFGFTAHLDFYEPAELEIIVRRSADLLGVALRDDGADEIAGRSRGTPRIANRLLRRVRDYAEVRADGVVTRDLARAALELYEVDEEGLDRLDRAVLSALVRRFGGGPVGLSTLAVAVGEEAETVEVVAEPFLVRGASWPGPRAGGWPPRPPGSTWGSTRPSRLAWLSPAACSSDPRLTLPACRTPPVPLSRGTTPVAPAPATAAGGARLRRASPKGPNWSRRCHDQSPEAVACWCAARAPLHFGSWSTAARMATDFRPCRPYGPARGQAELINWKEAPAMGNMHYLAASNSGGGSYTFLIVIVVLFGLLYFVMIRPQRNKQRQAQAMQSTGAARTARSHHGGHVRHRGRGR